MAKVEEICTSHITDQDNRFVIHELILAVRLFVISLMVFINQGYKFCLTEHTSSSLANIWSQENHSKWLLLFSRIPIDEHIIYLELHMQICPPQFKFKFQEREPLSLVKSVSVILGPPS